MNRMVTLERGKMVRLKIHFTRLVRWLSGSKCLLRKPDYPDSIPGIQSRGKGLCHKNCACTCASVYVHECMCVHMCR